MIHLLAIGNWPQVLPIIAIAISLGVYGVFLAEKKWPEDEGES